MAWKNVNFLWVLQRMRMWLIWKSRPQRRAANKPHQGRFASVCSALDPHSTFRSSQDSSRLYCECDRMSRYETMTVTSFLICLLSTTLYTLLLYYESFQLALFKTITFIILQNNWWKLLVAFIIHNNNFVLYIRKPQSDGRSWCQPNEKDFLKKPLKKT